MSLNHTLIKNVKPNHKSIRLYDSGGLYLEVSPTGGKWWRFKYRFDGKEKRLSMGVYPMVSLKDARARRDEARQQLANKIDPSVNRKAVKLTRTISQKNTFEVIARECFNQLSYKFSPTHCLRIIKSLENNIFPWIGHKPIIEISSPELLAIIKRIEERGAIETAHRVLQNCGRVFRYAIVTGRAERNRAEDLKGALLPVKEKHFAAIIQPKEIAQLLRAIDGYEGYVVIKSALRLAPLLFVRPGELRQAEWSEFDLDKAEWNIPAEKMKMKQAHLVPLSKQAIEILKSMMPITGFRKYVFPSIRSPNRPISNSTILAALRRMGYTKDEMTAHGFRAMARTVLDEVLNIRPDFIEHQLAHAVRDPNGRAYNRTAHLEERKKMMQQWADYLTHLKNQ